MAAATAAAAAAAAFHYSVENHFVCCAEAR